MPSICICIKLNVHKHSSQECAAFIHLQRNRCYLEKQIYLSNFKNVSELTGANDLKDGEPTKGGPNNGAIERCNDFHAPELSYNGSFNSSLLYGLPPVIPRLYSNPTAPIHGSNPSAEEAAAMARLSAAGLTGIPGWAPFLGHHQNSSSQCSTPSFGCRTSPFTHSFPFFTTLPLGLHPLDFSAMRLSGSLPSSSEFDLKNFDPRAVLSAYIGDLTNSRLVNQDHVPLTGTPTSESNVRASVCESSSGAAARVPDCAE